MPSCATDGPLARQCSMTSKSFRRQELLILICKRSQRYRIVWPRGQPELFGRRIIDLSPGKFCRQGMEKRSAQARVGKKRSPRNCIVRNGGGATHAPHPRQVIKSNFMPRGDVLFKVRQQLCTHSETRICA